MHAQRRFLSTFATAAIGFKIEDDNDFHIVISGEDDAETTLIAEIPDADTGTLACSSP